MSETVGFLRGSVFFLVYLFLFVLFGVSIARAEGNTISGVGCVGGSFSNICSIVGTWSATGVGTVDVKILTATGQILAAQNVAPNAINRATPFVGPGRYVLALYDHATTRLLATSTPIIVTSSVPLPVTPCTTNILASGQSLTPGQSLVSCDQRYRLTFQNDGNILLYGTGYLPLWATKTAGKGGVKLTMQNDGNLVLYTASRVPVWASSEFGGKYGASQRLILGNEGNLEIRSLTNALQWDRNMPALSAGTKITLKSYSTSEVLKVNSDRTTTDDQGQFTVVFDVTADNDDVWIERSALPGILGGVSYSVIDQNGRDVSATGTLSATLTSKATVDGTRYKVREGATERFTLTALYHPATTGFYAARINRVNFNAVNAAPNKSEMAPWTGFETDMLSISGGVYVKPPAPVVSSTTPAKPKQGTSNDRALATPAPAGALSVSGCIIGSAPSTLQPDRHNICDSKVSWTTTNASKNTYVSITGSTAYTTKNWPYGYSVARFSGVKGTDVPFWTTAGTYTLTLYVNGTRPTKTTPGTGIKLDEKTITIAPIDPGDGGGGGGSAGDDTGGSSENNAMFQGTNISQLASVLTALQQLLQFFK